MLEREHDGTMAPRATVSQANIYAVPDKKFVMDPAELAKTLVKQQNTNTAGYKSQATF